MVAAGGGAPRGHGYSHGDEKIRVLIEAGAAALMMRIHTREIMRYCLPYNMVAKTARGDAYATSTLVRTPTQDEHGRTALMLARSMGASTARG